MKIACVSYRDWALSIYDQLVENPDHEFTIIRSKEDYSEYALRTFAPDLIPLRLELDIEPGLIEDFQC